MPPGQSNQQLANNLKSVQKDYKITSKVSSSSNDNGVSKHRKSLGRVSSHGMNALNDYQTQPIVTQARTEVNQGTAIKSEVKTPSSAVKQSTNKKMPQRPIQKAEDSKDAQRILLMKQKAEERYKRNRNIYINTCNCRYELDTLQYVIGKNGFREVSNHPGQGHILWYGSALRDHDLDTIKSN